MKRFLIECGVSQPSTQEAIALDVHGPSKNVNLRIDYISRTMLGNVPDLLIDLLEVAAYVYCADQRLIRGSDKLTNFGENWRRSLRFSIPVREIEVWQDPEVHKILADTLGFLSDDSYEFDFRKTEAPFQPGELYFSDLTAAVSSHIGPLYRNELPPGSLLATCFSRGHIEAVAASDYDAQAKAFMDRLGTPVLEFALDENSQHIVFQGGHHLDGANFRVVEVLIENFRNAKRQRADVPFLPATELADRLSISEQSDLPPSEWPNFYFRIGHEGGMEWRGSTSRKRSSASCVKRKSCWRRAGRWQMRAGGLALRSRATTAGARNMVA